MTVSRRPVVLVGVVMLVVGLVATVASLRDSSARPAPTRSETETTTPSVTTQPPGGRFSPEDRVAKLVAQVEADPQNWTALAGLSSAYVAEAAVTGDPSLYPRAEEAVKRSLKVHPEDNLVARVAQSSLAAARHDFVLALKRGEEASALAPKNPSVKAVVGDAQLELGRYDEAFATFQVMIDSRPDLAAYSRISYARELQGDVDGAITAMKAAESAAGSKSDASFAAYQLGQLEWNRGHADAAVADYRRALEFNPTAVRSQAALARAAYFAGDIKGAIEQYRVVIARFPLPQYVGELADLYTVTGKSALAKEQLDLIEVQRRLFKAAGVSVDADLGLIDADYGVSVKSNLKAVRAEYQYRKSMFVADAVSWLLEANGQSKEALQYSDEAIRLGTPYALFYFHRSRIHRSLGDDDAARSDLAKAKAINPNFSIRYSKRP